RHKQCAFNLYAAAAMQRALAPMCRAFGDHDRADAVDRFGRALQAATIRKFWSAERGLFVNNLPWLDEEKSLRMCDRSLATAVLFDQCPDGQTAAAVKALAECPPEMGFSYPCNAGWRLWALGKAGRADVIVSDFRKRWATMLSVRENKTLQEDWTAQHDSGQQWSHCAVVPLYLAYHGLMRLRPLEPGFKRYELRPQPADLQELELTAFTVRGPIRMRSRGAVGDREIAFELPAEAQGELVLSEAEDPGLPAASGPAPAGCRRFSLPAGRRTHLTLKHT
ncbi:MAG TPA: alpha-L-rhamnosidase C-terminal domain-containing protein, partial [Anaerolineae bacterium]